MALEVYGVIVLERAVFPGGKHLSPYEEVVILRGIPPQGIEGDRSYSSMVMMDNFGSCTRRLNITKRPVKESSSFLPSYTILVRERKGLSIFL